MPDAEDRQPMLEMQPRVRPADDADVEAPPPPPELPRPETLAGEYAVGSGVPGGWDDPEPEEGCGEDCPETAFIGFCRSISRAICKCVGAKRLGHMSVLRYRRLPASSEPAAGGAWRRTRLDCVVGPFWPFTLCVTLPLIFCVSGAVLYSALPGHAVGTHVVWAAGVLVLLASLAGVACRDPGVLRRHPDKPKSNWRWNDQARTFRPPGAVYDEDLGLIVVGFDHVCPWTGTGIGEKNICAFHTFVTTLCVCIVIDVLVVMHVLP